MTQGSIIPPSTSKVGIMGIAPGEYAMPTGNAFSNTITTAVGSNCYFIPFSLPPGFVCDQVKLFLTTAQPGAGCLVGFYGQRLCQRPTRQPYRQHRRNRLFGRQRRGENAFCQQRPIAAELLGGNLDESRCDASDVQRRKRTIANRTVRQFVGEHRCGVAASREIRFCRVSVAGNSACKSNRYQRHHCQHGQRFHTYLLSEAQIGGSSVKNRIRHYTG